MMDDDANSQYSIYTEKLKRLRALDEKAARLGINTPAEIMVERIELRAETEAFSAALQSQVRAETVEKLGPVGRYQVLDYEIRILRERSNEKVDRVNERLSGKIDNNSDDIKKLKRLIRFVGIILASAVIIAIIVVAIAVGKTLSG